MSSLFRGLIIILIVASCSQTNCIKLENANIDAKSIDILRPDNDINEQSHVDISIDEVDESDEYSSEDYLADSSFLNESIENSIEHRSFSPLEKIIKDSEYIKSETQAIEDLSSIKSNTQIIEETLINELNEQVIDDSLIAESNNQIIEGSATEVMEDILLNGSETQVMEDTLINGSMTDVINNPLFNESATQAIEDTLFNESETQVIEDTLFNELKAQIIEDSLLDQTKKEIIVDQSNLENNKSFAVEALENKKTEKNSDDLLSDPVEKDDSRSNESITQFIKSSFQKLIEDSHTILEDDWNDKVENHPLTTSKKDSNNEISLESIINNNTINVDINLSSISQEKEINSKNRSPIERDVNPNIRDDSLHNSLFQKIEFDIPKDTKKYPTKIDDYISLNQKRIIDNPSKDKKHDFISEMNVINDESLNEIDLSVNDKLKKDMFKNKFVKKDERKFIKQVDLENELEFIDIFVENELMKNSSQNSKRQKFLNSFLEKGDFKDKTINKAEKSYSISVASVFIVFTLFYFV